MMLRKLRRILIRLLLNGESFEQVKKHMDGYSLIHSDMNCMIYSDKEKKQYYSYKFVNDSLCSSLLLMSQIAKDVDLSDIFKGYFYVGELDNAKVYHKTSKNVLAFTYEIDEKNSKYQAIGFTPIFPTADSFFGEENGHEYVDLGLSVKWATCNVGASKPDEYGGYYAWGETEEKDVYNWSTYKYNDNGYVNIGEDIAGTKYDVAHVKWGGSWQMPSSDQIKELYNNCTRKWTLQNGVNGILVTGPNGNTIFLPAAGIRMDEKLHAEGGYGYIWTSTKYDDTYVNGLEFNSTEWNRVGIPHSNGYSVRPVCP